ncbi:hypothetical protein [Salinicola peritrichatus]|uniref:hypothetical protein n=1 Tax=Salinicola peritrichatus TaxID=1267424 RepID=UPI00195505C4|nr:hypothetical protein [Salinicola peritrichatus]
MQHNKGQRLGIQGDLVEGVEMVAVEGLPRSGRRIVVVGAGRTDDRSADNETALLLDHQGTAIGRSRDSAHTQHNTNDACHDRNSASAEDALVHGLPSARSHEEKCIVQLLINKYHQLDRTHIKIT